MLGCDLIHGDLLAYNILGGWSGPVIIDFPQVIGAAHNSQAFHFFQRDLENVRHFFAAIDPALQASLGRRGRDRRAYERRELRPDFVPSGRAPEPQRRREHVPHQGSTVESSPPQRAASRPRSNVASRPLPGVSKPSRTASRLSNTATRPRRGANRPRSSTASPPRISTESLPRNSIASQRRSAANRPRSSTGSRPTHAASRPPLVASTLPSVKHQVRR